LAVTTSLVISSEIFCEGSAAKRTSRLVRMPTSFPEPLASTLSTTGTPEMRCRSISCLASESVAPGVMVTGFTTMPLS